MRGRLRRVFFCEERGEAWFVEKRSNKKWIVNKAREMAKIKGEKLREKYIYLK